MKWTTKFAIIKMLHKTCVLILNQLFCSIIISKKLYIFSQAVRKVYYPSMAHILLFLSAVTLTLDPSFQLYCAVLHFMSWYLCGLFAAWAVLSCRHCLVSCLRVRYPQIIIRTMWAKPFTFAVDTITILFVSGVWVVYYYLPVAIGST